MKKIVVFFALLLSLSSVYANNNAIGLWTGSLGNYWGVDFKHLDGSTAWNVYLNDFRFGDESAIGVGFGYYFLFNNAIKADASAGRFPLYFGPNIGFGYWSGERGPREWNGLDIGINLAGGISWFPPISSFKMDISIELLSPGFGHWHESSRPQPSDKWRTNNNPAIGFKGTLGIRLLFHAYLF
jgi:hypothetical protein